LFDTELFSRRGRGRWEVVVDIRMTGWLTGRAGCANAKPAPTRLFSEQLKAKTLCVRKKESKAENQIKATETSDASSPVAYPLTQWLNLIKKVARYFREAAPPH
jgi:hypothetical protein